MRAIITIIAIPLVLVLSDAAAKAVALPQDGPWLALISSLALMAPAGVIAGRSLGKQWVLVGLGPVLYYGVICLLMQKVMFLWIDLRMPLAVIVLLTGAFIGSLLPRLGSGKQEEDSEESG